MMTNQDIGLSCYEDANGPKGAYKEAHRSRVLWGFAAAACALAGAAPAAAAEEIIELQVEGQTIVGTLTLPDDVERPPVVLMLHGFTGKRSEWQTEAVPEGLFGRAAPAFAEQGIATLAIDFRGSGDSEGKFEDMTIHSEIVDGLAALDYLAELPEVDGSRMGVLGMSLGGIVATAVAGRTEHELSAVALWNPGINPPAAFTNMYGIEGVQEGLAAGDTAVAVGFADGSEGPPLKGAFFQSLFQVVPHAELTAYEGPLLLAVGTEDAIVNPQPTTAEALLSYHPGPHELWTRPVGHDFGALENGDTLDELIEATGTFFAEHLGTAAD